MNTRFATTLCCSIAAMLLAGTRVAPAAESLNGKPVLHDLAPLHDAARVLVNPDKGWYHHFPDNHPNKYQIARDADLLDSPAWITSTSGWPGPISNPGKASSIGR